MENCVMVRWAFIAMRSIVPRLPCVALACLAAPAVCLAQTDEIQVYDANIAEQGKFNLMIHNNFTPDGLKTPAFPGAVQSDKALVGVAEWAYGVRPWFEQGLYLPLHSYSQNDGMTYNGFKVRELFVRPNAADHTFFLRCEFRVQRQSKAVGREALYVRNSTHRRMAHKTSRRSALEAGRHHPRSDYGHVLRRRPEQPRLRGRDKSGLQSERHMGRSRRGIRRLRAIPANVFRRRSVPSNMGGGGSQQQEVGQYRSRTRSE